jgi:transposase InsO family protein
MGYPTPAYQTDDHRRYRTARRLSHQLHPDERGATATGFVRRALAWYHAQGVTPRRIMTDNAWAYTRNPSLATLLNDHGIRHLLIRPHTPRTNGKVERFHQTMSREWAYGVRYHDHHARDRALPYWLHHYNQRRPHSSLDGRPPISRVHNLCEQDI